MRPDPFFASWGRMAVGCNRIMGCSKNGRLRIFRATTQSSRQPLLLKQDKGFPTQRFLICKMHVEMQELQQDSGNGVPRLRMSLASSSRTFERQASATMQSAKSLTKTTACSISSASITHVPSASNSRYC